ncbi:hypothetical protein CCR95_04545 [Thiocystis minor]|uniref:hypothetical protein n=1 Tax=Thiocystis minor TaxID=61597 RepID=UPI0019124991|nr:hypothetical protein [Thiocystis minor]MBK5963377.1 hypothetical protein [Thiocystis minor]
MTRWVMLIVASLLALPVGAREPKDRDQDRRDKIIRPLIPGTSAPDDGAPAVIIKNGKVYDLIPGTHVPNDGSGRSIIQGR